MLRTTLLTGALLVAALSGQAQADTVAAWDMLGQPGDQALTAPAVSAPNVIAVNMVRGAGLNPSAAGNSMSSNGWDSTSADDYFGFGFDVAAGYSVALDELIIGTRSSNTGPGTVGIYSSLDGYANPLATIVQQGTNFANTIVDLSGLPDIVGSFRVRILEIGNTQADGDGVTASGGTFRVVDYFNGEFIDTQFTGTVTAVPEPSSIVLVGLGIVGLLVIRRHRCRG